MFEEDLYKIMDTNPEWKDEEDFDDGGDRIPDNDFEEDPTDLRTLLTTLEEEAHKDNETEIEELMDYDVPLLYPSCFEEGWYGPKDVYKDN